LTSRTCESNRKMRSRSRLPLVLLAVFVACLAAIASACEVPSANLPPPVSAGGTGIHKIKHIIIIMQENRSFDNYFGTFPGADGIPMSHGKPTVCVPDPITHGCVRPFHDPLDRNQAGPHGYLQEIGDIDRGKMDGFIRTLVPCYRHPKQCLGGAAGSHLRSQIRHPEVMGWHDAREIPNYWTYAKQFVLQDHLFEGVPSSSLSAHLDLVSGWSATCKTRSPMSCHTDLLNPGRIPNTPGVGPVLDGRTPYAWTDLTWLLHRAGVSWAYFVTPGSQPDCTNPQQVTCANKRQIPNEPDVWNPLPGFTDVHQDHQMRNIQSSNNFFTLASGGHLPAVSWVVPNRADSEDPPSSIRLGQAWVTSLIDAVMAGPDWSSSAIFLSWDDWGSFYDNVPPPIVNGQRYGIRVPGLVISPYARKGFIDHTRLSTNSYLAFIEDDFLAGARLNPRTDGRPDSRPYIAETQPGFGNFMEDFNFNQKPRPPMLLNLHPKPGPASIPGT
jgi:phospholipase C